MTRPLVIIESPFRYYAPPGLPGLVEPAVRAWREAANRQYARRCMADSIKRGEAPYLSHLLYTQCLDDNDPDQRATGLDCGEAWGRVAVRRAVYCDLGMSPGMLGGMRSRPAGQPVEYRYLYRGAGRMPYCKSCRCVLPPEVTRCPTCSMWQHSNDVAK